MSSMGAISPASAARAAALVCAFSGRPRTASSAPRARRQVGATLPNASRTSVDHAVSHFERPRKAHLGDGLRPPCADLSIMLPRPAPAAGEPHRHDQLVRRQIHRLVAGVERPVGDLAGAADRQQFQGRVVGEEGGRGVGGGRRVRDVAADGAAILRGDATGLPGGLFDQRELRAKDVAREQVGIGRQRTDFDLLIGHMNPAERVESPEADVAACA